MLAAVIYVVVGWLLLAVEAGLADVLSLTIMLPATSAVVLAHAASRRGMALPAGLAVAIVLGYLEDLHDSGPLGVLALTQGLAFLGFRWAAERLYLEGWVRRALGAAAAAALIDSLTLGTLLVMAESLGIRREALLPALGVLGWRWLATALAAVPIGAGIDALLTRLRLEDDASSGGGASA